MTRYRMPAEWLPQAGTWLAWPHNTDTWAYNLADAQREFAALVKTIAKFQSVFILCETDCRRQIVDAFANTDPNIHLVDIPTNDAWIRDYGPTFVVDEANGNVVAVDWQYNAWGGKYPPFDQDQKVAICIAKHLQVPSLSVDLCFEGGAIEINQSGLLLSTKSCVLDPNRNSNRSLKQIEQLLVKNLGATGVIWLTGDAIEGDDTDGHIDQLARFTDDQTIVYAWTDDVNDPQAARLQQNLDDLTAGLPTNADYCSMRLIPLPLPSPIHFRGARTPASYCNFIITNRQVVVPQFGVAEDAQAIEILNPLFPNREVIGLPSSNLSVGLGSFHCLTQQQPAMSFNT